MRNTVLTICLGLLLALAGCCIPADSTEPDSQSWSTLARTACCTSTEAVVVEESFLRSLDGLARLKLLLIDHEAFVDSCSLRVVTDGETPEFLADFDHMGQPSWWRPLDSQVQESLIQDGGPCVMSAMIVGDDGSHVFLVFDPDSGATN